MMQFWDNIVHTALLGTGKKQLKKEDLSEDLAETFELITGQSIDKETQFLHVAAVALNYRKCGIQPVNKALDYSRAEAEEKTYCNLVAHQLLTDIINSESFPLLKLWLERCVNANLIIKPEWLPVLFNLGIRYKPLQPSILTVTGKRGEWLVQFNEAWQVKTSDSDEEVWQTGTLDQRKVYLQILRTSHATKARELLQLTWPAENANTRAELLKIIATNISDEDVPWLEQLMLEKSQRVRDEALKLLKLCHSSSVVKKYWEIVQQSIHLTKERGLLGIGSKTGVEFELARNIDESIYKTGIEKISSEKNASDDAFILYQLVAAVPPSFFERHFELSKKALLDLFMKSKTGKRIVPAFGTAAIAFKEVDWLRAVMEVADDQFYPDAFKLLSTQELEKYALRFLSNEEQASMVLDNLQHFQEEWSLDLTRELFRFTGKNQYTYPRSFYSEHILHIPAAIIPELTKYAPTENYLKDIWSKTSEFITRQLILKTKTRDAFQQ